MVITPQQISQAETHQHNAAHDPNAQVRLIAGPGTGKSFSIQERVHWLLNQGINPDNIFTISFTRASVRDLRERIIKYCIDKGFQNAEKVSVTTLHSLALKSLRAAGLLAYPVDPLVLDNWELKNLHDPEYSYNTGYRPSGTGGVTPSRAKDIRLEYEAFCSTGNWRPPSYSSPSSPVSDQERNNYLQYHPNRTQLYSYVLPGEIVRQCVSHINSGSLDPSSLLGITHLIVDEYQDLNPVDLEYVDSLVLSDVNLFVAGDDDQSLYSFRYAFPAGIQTFSRKYTNSTDHQLTDCFRSTPSVLDTAKSLMSGFSDPNRIPKQLTSLYENSSPPENGLVFRWQFRSGAREANVIAQSCKDLISADIHPREIMILLSNTKAQLPILTQALEDCKVEFESPRNESFFDTNPGRFAEAIIRLACDDHDYVALRLILGLYPQVGHVLCDSVASLAITNNLNYKDLFYQPLPPGIFSTRESNAIQNVSSICSQVSNWSESDSLIIILPNLEAILDKLFGNIISSQLRSQFSHLPDQMTLLELRDYIFADNDEQQGYILESVYDRLGIPHPPLGFLPLRIRLITMHGSKGLGAKVVFIPGLEEDILPGSRRRPYPGLINEAARMLYVSISRARAVCILSYANSRIIYGSYTRAKASRFVPHLSGKFSPRNISFDNAEITQIVQSCSNL